MSPTNITHLWRWIVHFSVNNYWSLADTLLDCNDTHQYIKGPKGLRFQGGRATLWVERSMLWGGCGAREQIGRSDGGVESEGPQRTSWGGDPGAVSWQILRQDSRLWSLLREVGHTLHSPGLPASSEVSQPLKAEFLILRATDILG